MTETSTSTTPTKTTASEYVAVDSGKLPSEQPEVVKADPIYKRCLPELSAIADTALKDAIYRLRPSEAQLIGIWAPDKAGTPVPVSDVDPRVVLPLRTGFVDPRHPPYNGNPEHVARSIGLKLAQIIIAATEKQAQLGKAVHVWLGDAEIYGEIPAVLRGLAVNGMTLTKDRPLLYGKVTAFMRLK